MVTLAMVTKRKVFSESPARLSISGNFFFRISHRFRVICNFCSEWDFLISGQFYPGFGHGLQNCEFVARKSQIVHVYLYKCLGRQKFALTSALRPVDEFAKKDKIKNGEDERIRNDKDL